MVDSRTKEQKKKQTDEAIAAYNRGLEASLDEDNEPTFHLVNKEE